MCHLCEDTVHSGGIRGRYVWLTEMEIGEATYHPPPPHPPSWEYRSAWPNLQFWITTLSLGDRFLPECSRFLWLKDSGSICHSQILLETMQGGTLGGTQDSELRIFCCWAQVKYRPCGVKRRTKSGRNKTLWILVGTSRSPASLSAERDWSVGAGSVWMPEFISGLTKGFCRDVCFVVISFCFILSGWAGGAQSFK